MKCLGALDNFIVKLFLLESGMLGFFGSLFGSILGAAFMLLGGLSVLGHLDWGQFFVKMLVCIVVGTFLSVMAAVPPAIRAAKMQPIDAMRTEV